MFYILVPNAIMSPSDQSEPQIYYTNAVDTCFIS